jgi:hypothetical protein
MTDDSLILIEVKSWIVCDGDIDPEWIESLNSVLDDNRLLTMPSGERIQFGPNVNFLFETHDLSCASPATISRMGMIFLRYVNNKMHRPRNVNDLVEITNNYTNLLIATKTLMLKQSSKLGSKSRMKKRKKSCHSSLKTIFIKVQYLYLRKIMYDENHHFSMSQRYCGF